MLWQKCEICSKPFQAKRSTAKYCSNKCRAASFRLRRIHAQQDPELKFDAFELGMLKRLKRDFSGCYSIISRIYQEHGSTAAYLALRACAEILETVSSENNQSSDNVNNEATFTG